MSPSAAAGLVALVLATQVIDTRACSPRSDPAPSPNPSPSPAPSPAPGADTSTTSDGIRFTVETVVAGLQIPWAMAFAPDGRLFVSERGGRITIYNLTTRASELALTIPDVAAEGEGGGLGIALDPDFARDPFVYLYYTGAAAAGRANRVVRYREVNSRLIERVVLLDGIPAAGIHNGGRIRFGPDGLLYISAGDAANTGWPQDLASYAGKFLRIARDGSRPQTNPFASPVYSYGHRNPQGLDWHPATGDLWASEHGNVGNDEINVITAGSNYGWPLIEATATMPGMHTPIVFYNPAIAPSGASFYRGQRFPGFTDNLFVATLRGMHLLRLGIDGRRVVAQERLLVNRYGRLRDVIAGPDGYLYVATNNRTTAGGAADDLIVRLVPAG